MPKRGGEMEALKPITPHAHSLPMNQVGRRCCDTLISGPASSAKQARTGRRNLAPLVPAKVWASQQRRPTTFRVSKRESFRGILSPLGGEGGVPLTDTGPH